MAVAKAARPCAALKADGTRCKRKVAGRSKYCPSHKGYRPTGIAAKRLSSLKKARAVKSIRKRAKTAKGGKGPIRNRPAAIKVLGSRAKCAATTASGSACKNLPAKGSKYCTRHKGYRPKRK